MTEFEQAYKKYKMDMYRAVRRTGIHPRYAMDCVQEAALQLSRMNTISYVEPHRVKGLFCKAAEREGYDALRKIDANRRMQQNLYDYTPPRKKENESDALLSLDVHKALALLPKFDSYLAWKYYAERESLRGISASLLKDWGLTWPHKRIRLYLKNVVRPKLKELLKHDQ